MSIPVVSLEGSKSAWGHDKVCSREERNYRRLGLGHRHMKLCNTAEFMSGASSQECENTTEGGNRHGKKAMSWEMEGEEWSEKQIKNSVLRKKMGKNKSQAITNLILNHFVNLLSLKTLHFDTSSDSLVTTGSYITSIMEPWSRAQEGMSWGTFLTSFRAGGQKTSITVLVVGQTGAMPPQSSSPARPPLHQPSGDLMGTCPDPPTPANRPGNPLGERPPPPPAGD